MKFCRFGLASILLLHANTSIAATKKLKKSEKVSASIPIDFTNRDVSNLFEWPQEVLDKNMKAVALLPEDQRWDVEKVKIKGEKKVVNKITLPYVTDLVSIKDNGQKKHRRKIKKAIKAIQKDFDDKGINVKLKEMASPENAADYSSTERYIRILPVATCSCSISRQLKASFYTENLKKSPIFEAFFGGADIIGRTHICDAEMEECQEKHHYSGSNKGNFVDYKVCIERTCLENLSKWQEYDHRYPEEQIMNKLDIQDRKVMNANKVFLNDGDRSLDVSDPKSKSFKTTCIRTLFKNLFYDDTNPRKIKTDNLSGMPLNCLPESVFALSHRGRVDARTYNETYKNNLGQPIYLNRKHKNSYEIILKRRILQVLGLSWNHQNQYRDASVLNINEIFDKPQFGTEVKDRESLNFGKATTFIDLTRIDTDSIMFHPEILFSPKGIKKSFQGHVKYSAHADNNKMNYCDAYRIEKMYPGTNKKFSEAQLKDNCITGTDNLINKCECMNGNANQTCAYPDQEESCERCDFPFHKIKIGSKSAGAEDYQCRRYPMYETPALPPRKEEGEDFGIHFDRRKRAVHTCPKEFSLDIEVGTGKVKSLIFVIDNTDSMSAEMEDVKLLLKSFLYPNDSTLSIHSTYQQVILMPFNDPCIGPMTVITADGKINSRNKILKAINDMTVYGGGDAKELMFSGMEKVMHQAGPDSMLYVITDDWIKDDELAPKVERLAQQKRMTINFIFTFNNVYRRQWKSNWRKRLPQKNMIKKLRRMTNGLVFFSNLKEENSRENVLTTLRSHITKKTTTHPCVLYTKEVVAESDDRSDKSIIPIDSTILEADVFRISVTGVTKLEFKRSLVDYKATQEACRKIATDNFEKAKSKILEVCHCDKITDRKWWNANIPERTTASGKKLPGVPENCRSLTRIILKRKLKVTCDKYNEEEQNKVDIARLTDRCMALADDAESNQRSKRSLMQDFPGVDAVKTKQEILAVLKFDPDTGIAEPSVSETDVLDKMDAALKDEIVVLENCTIANYATIEINPIFFKRPISMPFNVKSALVIESKLYHDDLQASHQYSNSVSHTIIAEAITNKASDSIGINSRDSVSFPHNFQQNQQQRRKRATCDKKMFDKCKLCKMGLENHQGEVDYSYDFFDNHKDIFSEDEQECLVDYAYDILNDKKCGGCENLEEPKCEEVPRYCENIEEAMNSAYVEDNKDDDMFDELDELEKMPKTFKNCIPKGFITRIQFMDENGVIHPTCGNADVEERMGLAESDNKFIPECFGKEMTEDEFIPVEILTKTKFNALDDTVDIETEDHYDNMSLIDLVEEVPDVYQRIRLVGFINVEKEVEIDGEKCMVNVRERFDRITKQATHLN